MLFYIIKIEPPAYTCKMAAKYYNSSDTNSRVTYGVYTSKPLSEGLFFASTNQKYYDRLFIELQVQYLKFQAQT